MKKTSFISAILLIWSCAAMAQEVRTLSVEELFELGIQNSTAIRMSVTNAQIAEDAVHEAKNKELPEIGLDGSFAYTPKARMYDHHFGFAQKSTAPDWGQNYTIAASQPLYGGGQLKNTIKKAELEEQIARLSLQKDKADLKLWLIGQYLDLFNYYKERDVYTTNIKEAETRLHDIENMRAQGMITDNDVLRSRLVLSNYQLALEQTENSIALTSQQLDIVMGLDENTILSPDSVALLAPMPIRAEEEYINAAYAQYPEMQLAAHNILLAQNNLKLTRSAFIPTLSLQAGNMLARPIPYLDVPQDLYINTWHISLVLSWRISAFYNIKRSMSSARQQISLQKLAEEEQKQQVRTDIRTALVRHREAEDRVRTLEASLMQANENYRIMKNKYFNQLSILTDLLDANTVQLDAELQLTSAKTNAIYTWYQLQKVSGNL